jgi:hypothetical protein
MKSTTHTTESGLVVTATQGHGPVLSIEYTGLGELTATIRNSEYVDGVLIAELRIAIIEDHDVALKAQDAMLRGKPITWETDTWESEGVTILTRADIDNTAPARKLRLAANH